MTLKINYNLEASFKNVQEARETPARIKGWIQACFHHIICKTFPKYYPNKINKRVSLLNDNIDSIKKSLKGFTPQNALNDQLVINWKRVTHQELTNLKKGLEFNDPRTVAFKLYAIEEVKKTCALFTLNELQRSYVEYEKKCQNSIKRIGLFGKNESCKEPINDLKNKGTEVVEKIEFLRQDFINLAGQYGFKLTDPDVLRVKEGIDAFERRCLSNYGIKAKPEEIKAIRQHKAERKRILDSFERNINSCFREPANPTQLLKEFNAAISRLETERKRLKLEESSIELKYRPDKFVQAYKKYSDIENARPFEVIETIKDGHCLYDALVKGNVAGQPKDRVSMRKNIADHICKNENTFNEIIVSMLRDEYISGRNWSNLPAKVKTAFEETKKRDTDNQREFQKLLNSETKENKKILQDLWRKTDIEDLKSYNLSQKSAEDFLKYWTKQSEIIHAHQDWVKPYIEGMGTGRSFGGPAEIYAFHLMTNVPIRIYTTADFSVKISYGCEENYDPEKTIHVIRPVDSAHYKFLKPKPQAKPLIQPTQES